MKEKKHGPFNLVVCESFPTGVVLINDTVMINCGDRSPDWVNAIAKQEDGAQLLVEILRRLMLGETYDEVCKEIAEAVEAWEPDLHWN